MQKFEHLPQVGVMLNRKRGRVEFGEIKGGWAANMVFAEDLYQKFQIAQTSDIMLLVRREFFELYIGGVYVSSWRSGENIDPNSFGMYFEDCSGEAEELKIYEMK